MRDEDWLNDELAIATKQYEHLKELLKDPRRKHTEMEFYRHEYLVRMGYIKGLQRALSIPPEDDVDDHMADKVGDIAKALKRVDDVVGRPGHGSRRPKRT